MCPSSSSQTTELAVTWVNCSWFLVMMPKYIDPWTPKTLKMKALCSFDMLENTNAVSHPRRPDCQQISFRNISYHKIIALVRSSMDHTIPQPNMKLNEPTVRLEVLTAVLLKIQVFWYVMHCRSVPPDLLKSLIAFISELGSSSGSDWPQRWRHCDPLKHRELLPQEHFTSQTNWISKFKEFSHMHYYIFMSC